MEKNSQLTMVNGFSINHVLSYNFTFECIYEHVCLLEYNYIYNECLVQFNITTKKFFYQTARNGLHVLLFEIRSF